MLALPGPPPKRFAGIRNFPGRIYNLIMKLIAGSIAGKIIAPYILILFILAMVAVFVVSRLVSGSLDEQFTNKLLDRGKATNEALVKVEAEQLQALRLMANTNGVAEAIVAKDAEQLRTFVRLACAQGPEGWRASAFIMERVAGEGGIAPELDSEAQEEAWRTAVILAGTLSDAEMLDDALPASALLHRLFHAEGLELDRARALSYGCRCSRAKLAGVLQGFPAEDLDHMAEDGAITMTCEFCNLDFRFARSEMQSGAGRA